MRPAVPRGKQDSPVGGPPDWVAGSAPPTLPKMKPLATRPSIGPHCSASCVPPLGTARLQVVSGMSAKFTTLVYVCCTAMPLSKLGLIGFPLILSPSGTTIGGVSVLA